MKRLLIVLAVIGFTASLGAQSVVELAKREKARRESLAGRHAAVVNNHDLLQVKKTAAVEVAVPVQEGSEGALAEDQGTDAEVLPSDDAQSVPPSGSGAPSGRRIVPRVASNGPLITGDANRDQAETGGTLDAQLKSANDLVDLLTTKMNALRQQFEFQDNMVPGYVIQKQIDETNQRLVKAQAQQARIQAEMEKKGLAKKDPGAVDR
jgi:type II secretory pathway pseudopilin PulG